MASFKWYKALPGVRYREHDSRKHGIGLDRYFTIRYTVDGKSYEEGLGWATEGWTAKKAQAELVKLKEAKTLGMEEVTLRAKRATAKRQRDEKEHAEKAERRAQITVSEFWEKEYLSAQIHKKEHSRKTELGLYNNWIKPVLGDVPIKQLNTRQLTELGVHMQEAGKSPRTIQYVQAIISQMWKLAQDCELVSGDSPSRKMKRPKLDNRRIGFLTPDNARLLLTELAKRSPDLHDSALLSLFCGLRAGEIHALTWADINFAAGNISIRDPKNTRNRFAYMPEEVRHMLESRYQNQRRDELVFPAKNGGVRGMISKCFSKTVEDLKLNEGITDPRNKVVFHTLRHTFASWQVQRGTPIYTLATLMGHSSQEMTQRYAHLAPDQTKLAALSLSGILDDKA